MVGANFFWVCVTVGAASFGPQDTQSPELRTPHLMLLRARRFFRKHGEGSSAKTRGLLHKLDT